jgi:hypothetical protein
VPSWGFEFFSLGVPAVFLREGYAGNVMPFRVLVVVQITSFLLSARGLEFLSFDGGSGILCSNSVECRVCVHCRK